MRVLVACEESQVVANEFRKLGHEAQSCDIQDCSGGHPEYHIKADATELLKIKWDLIIAHPPCTYLTNASSVRLRVNGVINPERMRKAVEAKEFFMKFYNADCPRIAIENPVPGRIHELPRYNQIIEPYMFGDPWKKRTCLWLRGLPPSQQQTLLSHKDYGWELHHPDEMQGYIPDMSLNQIVTRKLEVKHSLVSLERWLNNGEMKTRRKIK